MAVVFAHPTSIKSCGWAVRGKLLCPVGCNVDNKVEKSGHRKGRVLLIAVWKDTSQIQMGQGEDEGHGKLGEGQGHIHTKHQR